MAELLREEISAAASYAAASRAASARRMYQHNFDRFSAWCAVRGLEAMPADPRVDANFLTSEAAAGIKAPTLNRRLSAIR